MEYVIFITSMLLFGISMCFTPGPNNAIAMATGMDKGFRAALPFCLGSAAGANISLILLGFGLVKIFEAHPVIYDFLRYAGALYMLWLAWRISGLAVPSPSRFFKRKGREELEPAQEPMVRAEERRGMKPFTFVQGVFFQLVNVKVWITNIVVVSAYIGAGENAATRLILSVVLFTLMGGTAMCLWAAGGVFMGRFLTSDGMRRANLVFASFLLLSIILIFV